MVRVYLAWKWIEVTQSLWSRNTLHLMRDTNGPGLYCSQWKYVMVLEYFENSLLVVCWFL